MRALMPRAAPAGSRPKASCSSAAPAIACARRAFREQQVELAFAGDLQAQCTASNYTMRQLGMPFAGLYGACSTMAETLCLAAVFAAELAMAERVLAHEQQPLLRGGAAVPHPAGVRRQTHPHRPVDCHRCRGLPGAGARRAGVPVLSATFGRVQDAGVMISTIWGRR